MVFIRVTGTALREILDRPSAKIDQQDAIYGETALHKIVRFQRMENLKAIAERNAKRNVKRNGERNVDVNIQDFKGNTALHKASHCSNVMLWKTLLSLGGDVRAANDNFLTPKQLATKAKNFVALAMINQYSDPEE